MARLFYGDGRGFKIKFGFGIASYVEDFTRPPFSTIGTQFVRSTSAVGWTPWPIGTEGGAYNLTLDPGSYGITGLPAGILADRILSGNPGTYNVTGFNADVVCGRVISVNPGEYIITGVQAGLIANRIMYANPGGYSITGFNAAILAGRQLSAEIGVYQITGFITDLIYTPVTGYFLSVDPGNYEITGSNTSLLANRILNVESGVYVLTGVEAGIVAGRILTADPGSYILTGVEAKTLADRILNAEPGTYNIIGMYAVLAILMAYSMNAEPGSYLIVGSAARAVLEVDMIISGAPTVGEISNAVWTHADAEFILACINNEKYLSKDGTTWYLTIKNNQGTGNILRKALKDKDDHDITDIQAGVLSKELANSA